MATSNTTNFDLSNAQIIFEAFDRCGIRPTSLTNHHMVSARNSLNLELANWSNLGVNLWAVDLQEQELTAATSEYTLSPDTVIVLDAYIRTQADGADPVDRILNPLSRTDYAMLPNKDMQGFPTIFWFDRTITPTITLWQVPDDTQTYTLRYYRMRRLQDASPTMGQTADIPFRFLEALCAGMAARLARKFAPALVDSLKMEAKEMWTIAMIEDRERVPIFIRPQLEGYYQN